MTWCLMVVLMMAKGVMEIEEWCQFSLAFPRHYSVRQCRTVSV